MVKVCSVVMVMAMAASGLSAQGAKPLPAAEAALVGTWSGSWTGGSSGSVQFTFSRGADGKLTGTATPHQVDGDPYDAPFTSIVVNGAKVTLTMSTPDGSASITVAATVEGGEMKGEYAVRGPDGTEVDKGTVTAKKRA